MKHKQIITRLKALNSSGDTIVEVLIAIAIVSVVLVGAFAASSTAQRTSQGARERDQAVKIAQGQLENIRINNGLGDENDVLCYAKNGDELFDAVSCTFDSSMNSPCSSPPRAFCYRVSDSFDDSSGVYVVNVEWDGLKNSKEQVKLSYKLPVLVFDSGSTGGPDGSAGVTDPCKLPVAERPPDTSCPGPHVAPPASEGGHYKYQKTFINISPAAQDPFVASCTWTILDEGVTTTITRGGNDPICKHGGTIKHTFSIPPEITAPGAPPYPYYCGNAPTPPGPHALKHNKVTLRERFSNGAPDATYTYSGFNIPLC